MGVDIMRDSRGKTIDDRVGLTAVVLLLLVAGLGGSSIGVVEASTECNDGIDNDGDSVIDGYDSNGNGAVPSSSSFGGYECGTGIPTSGGQTAFMPCEGWFSESYSIPHYQYDNDGSNVSWWTIC